jgi:hypothetical protein
LIRVIRIVVFILLCIVYSADTWAQDNAWKFVVFGDCRGGSKGPGVNVEILNKLAGAVADENPAFVMFSGDQIYGHANRKERGDEKALERLEEEFRVFIETMQPIYRKGIPVYNLRGNHETTQRNPDKPGTPDHRPIWPRTKEAWDAVFSGTYANPDNGPDGEKNVTFSFVHENALIIGLDGYSAPEGTPTNKDGSIKKIHFHRINQTWLDEQLRSNRAPHVFVSTHEPAFKLDHNDCLHGNDAYGLDNSVLRDSLWNSLRKAGARVFFCGHDHGYAHARIDDRDGNPGNDIHQFVVGTAGAGKNLKAVYDGYNGAFKPVPVMHDNSYGYMVVEVAGPDVTLTYKRLPEESESGMVTAEVFQYQLK